MKQSKALAVLQLIRPANVLTALSDVWAGMAIALAFTGGSAGINALWLSLSTMALYAGGIVMNDVFDYRLDKKERPERVLPSGRLSLSAASNLGFGLLSGGVLIALLAGAVSGLLALLISVSALIYDRWGKHHSFWGPPNMGLCRGLNLLLGVSLFPQALPDSIFLALVPIAYIAAITLISRGEVHGSGRRPLQFAFLLYALVIGGITWYGWYQQQTAYALVFLLGFCAMIFPPLFRAHRRPSGPLIGRAVRAGVLALILMNASWAAASGYPLTGVFISVLLPISLWFSRRFAVT